MISLELAKKLKEAGLEWEPQRGDWYYFGDDGELHLLRVATPRPVPEVVYFAPRLDQLLAEIEGRGYGWKLEKFHAYNLRRMQIYKINDLLGCFEADSPEEAAAEALLWIYERRVKE